MKKVLVILISLLTISLLAGCKEKKSEQAVTAEDYENETVATTVDETDVKSVLAYLKLGSVQSNGQLELLFDEVLFISWNEPETILKYGYDPEDVGEFLIHNEVEEWASILTSPQTIYTIVIYDYNSDMVVQFIEVDLERFKQHLNDKNEFLADITISASGSVYSVKERYMP